MKIGAKIGDHEIKIGDLFYFDSEKLEGTPFIGLDIYKDLKANNANGFFLYFGLNKDYNQVEYELRYTKDKQEIKIEKAYSSMFLHYLTGKDEVITWISNDNKEANSVERVSELPISEKIEYGDIFKVPIGKVKKSGYMKKEFLERLLKKGVTDLIFHFFETNKEIKYSHDNFSLSVYAISKKGFEDFLTQEEIDFYEKRYAESGNVFDKRPHDIINYLNRTSPVLIKIIDIKHNFLTNKIGNNKEEYKLDYSHIKHMVELKPKENKLKM